MPDHRRIDEILERVRERLRYKMIDMDRLGTPKIAEPLSPATLASDERSLGFAIPPLLACLYQQIGNGGFGPGYGLLGLTGGIPDDQGDTAPEVYRVLRSWRASDQERSWSFGLLPICYWGCGIYSCIDCGKPEFPMRFFDPNVEHDKTFDDAMALEAWIEAWANGTDLWRWSYRAHSDLAAAIEAQFVTI